MIKISIISSLKTTVALLAFVSVIFLDTQVHAAPLSFICSRYLTQPVASGSAETDPYDLAIAGADLRSTIMARRRAPLDINFEVPEFKPILIQMLAELKKLKERNDKISTRNPFHGMRNQFFVPVRIGRLESKIVQALNSRVAYWPTIELGLDFALIVDSMNLLEGTSTSFDRYHVRTSYSFYLKQLKLIAESYPILIVPTFKGLSNADINRTWGKGIAPIGLVTQMTDADFNRYGGRGFIRHDIQHLEILVQSIFELVTKRNGDPIAIDDPERVGSPGTELEFAL